MYTHVTRKQLRLSSSSKLELPWMNHNSPAANSTQAYMMVWKPIAHVLNPLAPGFWTILYMYSTSSSNSL